jgi:hypothetical protein
LPIDSQHPSYDAYAQKWKRARDASKGQDAVHKAGIDYLPRLKDQTEEDYSAYKQRASYFNATGRTIDGLVGMVFRKEPQIEQTGIDSIIDDVDLAGNSLTSFAQYILREVLTVDRFGVLVEYPTVQSVVVTQADAQAQNLRPYATHYPTESILNWKVERINNVMQPTLVVLQEMAEVSDDGYEAKHIDQLRELRLLNGVYIQRIWQKDEKTKKYVQIGGDIKPLMNNAPLRFIPFFAFGADENSLEIHDAPILPIADLNLAHYRVTADYEHGCHFTGLPMLFFAGISTVDAEGKNTPIYVGSQQAMTSTLPEAHAEYIEFTGQGLGAIEKNLDRKEKQMAVLGARMLEQQKNGVESEGAMQMRANGENSTLASIAKLLADQLSNMLMFMADWSGVASDVTVTLNTDYLPVGMTAEQLNSLVGAWQAGAISKQVLFNNLQRGEVINDGVSFKDEEEEIGKAPPNLSTE